MTAATVPERFAELPDAMDARSYNYTHFRPEHIWRDAQRIFARAGVQPGQLAPDFELPTTDGGVLRLSDLRGAPVLLRFGSYT
jgi:hypothetical protein